jgi:hypothetical protein
MNERRAQKMIRKGVAGKGSRSKGCRGAEHGQKYTKDRTGAVALRAALESAVRLGRGDEVNRQAEMANPTKRRDSPQPERPCKVQLKCTRTNAAVVAIMPCARFRTMLDAQLMIKSADLIISL